MNGILNLQDLSNLNMLFTTYSGISMYPTLQAPQLLEVIPYSGASVRAGDVVLFKLERERHIVVHRVVRITPQGIHTRGDNNFADDDWVVTVDEIIGQVVATWRGSKRRRVPGGLMGNLLKHWSLYRKAVDQRVSRLLHTYYIALADQKFISHLVPLRFRPKVVAFQANGQEFLRLLWGTQIVGWYNYELGDWTIRRPFRLLVNKHTIHAWYGKLLSID